jgi:S-formylglutathione hydrolase FrmB
MPLAEVHYVSRSVGLNMGMNVLLPGGNNPGPFPVFYLLHGLTDDHTIWSRRSNIEWYVEGLPLIVVMPETGRGWYSNSKSHPGRNYEDAFIKDVVGFVDRTFRTIPKREARVLGGLSMGGYGAVKMALKFPDLFCAAASHSGPLMHPLHKLWEHNRPAAAELEPEFLALFGSDWRGGGDDLVALARKCPARKRPKLWIDCGVRDFLIENNREFHRELKKQKFPHTYKEFEGVHDWKYWDEHVKDAIAFHADVLGIKRK